MDSSTSASFPWPRANHPILWLHPRASVYNDLPWSSHRLRTAMEPPYPVGLQPGKAATSRNKASMRYVLGGTPPDCTTIGGGGSAPHTVLRGTSLVRCLPSRFPHVRHRESAGRSGAHGVWPGETRTAGGSTRAGGLQTTGPGAPEPGGRILGAPRGLRSGCTRGFPAAGHEPGLPPPAWTPPRKFWLGT